MKVEHMSEKLIEDFAGCTAVVTGGASGIGAAIASALHRRGAEIIILDLIVEDIPDSFHGIVCDISKQEEVHAAATQISKLFDRVDILVNNAGVGAQGTIEDNTDDEWHGVFDINVLGMVRVTKALLPLLRKSGRPSIVNTCSVAATVGLPQRALYSATKGAVLALTRAMAADYLLEGIRVNAVNPGTADTPWINNLLSKANDPLAERQALEARQPHGRLVSPEEVAAAVTYLAGPLSGSTTGSYLAVDGGMESLRVRAPQA